MKHSLWCDEWGVEKRSINLRVCALLTADRVALLLTYFCPNFLLFFPSFYILWLFYIFVSIGIVCILSQLSFIRLMVISRREVLIPRSERYLFNLDAIYHFFFSQTNAPGLYFTIYTQFVFSLPFFYRIQIMPIIQRAKSIRLSKWNFSLIRIRFIAMLIIAVSYWILYFQILYYGNLL